MKVGILTFPNSISYGATLQMMALQEAVNRLGHQAEVINYHSAYMKAEQHLRKSKRDWLRFAVQRRLRRLRHRRLYAAFRDFETQHAQVYPHKAFSDKATLAKVGQRYDAVICGSDQVWCPMITGGDLSYFLDFCTPKTKRIAYAPSFGAESFSQEFYDQIGPELRQFSSLSARELPGKRIVEELTERETTLVADPTFLAERSDWEKMEQPHPLAQGDYILYFVVRQSESLFRQCEAFSKKHGIKMVVIGGNASKVRHNQNPLLEYALDVGPEQWLYLVHHARCVFTNSFHGMAFSVIFQKDLYVQYPPHTASRLRQVMETLGLTHRVIAEGEEPPLEPVDYTEAEKVFASIKEQSLSYLKTALQE